MDSDKDHITIKWAAPISNGGSPIVGYDIERRDIATGRWIKLNKDPVGRQEFTDDRVQEGHAYEYRVSAVNAAGPGKPSDTSNAFVAKPMKGMLSRIQEGFFYKKCSLQKNQNFGLMALLVVKSKYALVNQLTLTFHFPEHLHPQLNGKRMLLTFQNLTEFP